LVAGLFDRMWWCGSEVLTLSCTQNNQGFERAHYNAFATPILLDHMRQRKNWIYPVFVSPDIGGVVRARAVAKNYERLLSGHY